MPHRPPVVPAWEALPSYNAIRRLCAALVDEQSADDLAQETFARLSRVREGPPVDSPAAWAASVARHVCQDEIRSRMRRRDKESRFGSASPTESPDLSESLVIEDLIRQLDPERRLAFVLTQVVQLSYREAAEVCGCPTGTIRSRVARARDDLIKMAFTEARSLEVR